MGQTSVVASIDVPLSLLAPVRLNKQASAGSSGLFFPHRTNLPLGLAVNWDGETHLIHLTGPYAYKEAGIEMGHPIRGAVINQIEYRVDVTSRYNSGEACDPAGALVVKDGDLFLYCRKLGDQFHDDPHPVPLGGGYPPGVSEEACGFTRWSISVREDGKAKVLCSFEALGQEKE